MKKLYLGSAAAAALIAAGAAFAQPAPMPAPQAQMHRGAMRTETRDQVASHVAKMFARLDSNRDGYVTRQEAQAAHPRMAGARMAAGGGGRGAAFDRLDANKDGSISRQEWDAGRQAREQRMAMRQGDPGMMRVHRVGMGFGHGRMFETADANKDGYVSLQEATAAALQHFDAADLNHDGKLTPQERMQARQQLRAQRRPA